MLEFHLKLPFPIEHPQTLKIVEQAREQSVLMLLFRHRDVFSTDIFLTDTFSTNKEVDIFSTSNKMGHIFDH